MIAHAALVVGFIFVLGMGFGFNGLVAVPAIVALPMVWNWGAAMLLTFIELVIAGAANSVVSS